MGDDTNVTALLKCYEIEREHARHHERQIAMIIFQILALIAGIVAGATKVPTEWPLLVRGIASGVVITLCVLTAYVTMKTQKVSAKHIERSRAYRKEIAKSSKNVATTLSNYPELSNFHNVAHRIYPILFTLVAVASCAIMLMATVVS